MISTFDIFKIGLGPSSSHTMGPMFAAGDFVHRLFKLKNFSQLTNIRIDLYGSLALTGIGHCTDKALLLGLEGETPSEINPDTMEEKLNRIIKEKQVRLLRKIVLDFDPDVDVVWFRKKSLAYHPNGMVFTAFNAKKEPLLTETYYSIGGGRILTEKEAQLKQKLAAESKSGSDHSKVKKKAGKKTSDPSAPPYPFTKAAELLALCSQHKKSIADLMFANELCVRKEPEIRAQLKRLRQEMSDCIDRGCRREGNLPGRLKVKRRASLLFQELSSRPEYSLKDPLTALDWVNLYAMAVNEENASGYKVVTAPTNGASGIIPAVMRYYERFCPGANEEGGDRFLLTAAAIGILYAINASLSGAEVGCQGEVGVACSMAAGGLTAALGGTPEQIEQAAEIGMEHNLGLTCDPIGGLVQIPCIERNAMGSIKAINASRLAMRGDGKHYVSLDSVIRTMWVTGADMKTKYKETSRGGLAVNVPEC